MKRFLLGCLLILGSYSVLAIENPPEFLTETERIIHVLNRLGFGPKPGDIERVEAMGVASYIEEQLHPEKVSDPGMEDRLSRYETLATPAQDLFEEYRQFQAARRKARTKDRRNEMEQGEQPMIESERRRILLDLAQARLTRAVHSRRQLQEVMVDFWMNHFNIFMFKGLDRVLMADFEEKVIRPNAFGKFEDLLMATAKSPAMLFYLDNWLSSAPSEVIRQRIQAMPRQQRGMLQGQAQGRARQFLSRLKGLNENYARELLELHTLGVDAGFTQEDVIQVAKCFTGWTIDRRRGLQFGFQPLMHESGDKIFMGHTIKSGGIEEGEQVIQRLAHNPATARFISTKLVRRFVADEPPSDLVQAAARSFERTGGDIREVLRTILTSPQFFSTQYHQAKVKKPLELVASSLRAVAAQGEPHPYLIRTLSEMGEALYLCPTPDGYPDTAAAWINTNSLLKRLNFAMALTAGRIPNLSIDLESGGPLLHRLGLPRPNADQQEQTRELLATEPGSAHPQVIVAAFMLGSPQFQKR